MKRCSCGYRQDALLISCHINSKIICHILRFFVSEYENCCLQLFNLPRFLFSFQQDYLQFCPEENMDQGCVIPVVFGATKIQLIYASNKK
jgi:hypothetical protein